ncbi:MAG: NAD(P)(+) transhydrogenase (Re/Si-specific) subunit beta [Bryobacterales bacterium]|nr:NAD(P)(+) transhydrogenase (Re/Si-specific) subunit beta [Bryobacteraceae bacterium]MDW8355890.1 NAD(P)(+) transhydrogenase (Re/Si-specific) subunit beta [Bryobacterales bacterium]
MPAYLVNLAYLLASALFIFGLKGLAHPRTAVRGNLLGATGMLIAIVVTLADRSILSYELIVAGFVVGGFAGAVMAVKVPMTGMPQMVALLNGFGGAASALVAGAALFEAHAAGLELSRQFTVATAASALIGGVTFWGSLVAFAKLQELISGHAVVFRGQHVLNALIAAVCLALGIWLVAEPETDRVYWLLVAASSVLGVLTTIPIGGADMPVVISLLNSYSGLAAAATGFVLSNNMLIIAGSLVGASGLILTQIMCRAMNRSLANVLFGGLGAVAVSKAEEDKVYAGKVKAASPEEIAMMLETARRVIIVPGYGMAVSQAQHAVQALAKLLESRGTEVLYAIHPVAGRMPGHMNVLLAEADVPYEALKDMDEVNPLFPETDVAIVIGANDVVNPLARTDPKSPIAGMPILDVDKARTVVVIKRSLSPGFAGIPNPLFAADNTLMYFSDGKKAVNDLIHALKEAA